MGELSRLIEVLRASEQASSDGSVVVDFRNGAEELAGRVASENGRICWAISRTPTQRISDIFAEECGLSRAQLEEVFEASKAEGRPFGECLVDRCLVDDGDLRRALRRQMVAALGSMAALWAGGAAGSWSASKCPELSYDPSYTMTPMELLFSCIEGHPGLRASAGAPPASFTRLAVGSGAALCFRLTEDELHPLAPVAVVNAGSLGVADSLVLARHALSVARPPALEAASIRPFAVLVHAAGRGVFCMLQPPHLAVFEIDEGRHGEVLAGALAEMRRQKEGRTDG